MKHRLTYDAKIDLFDATDKYDRAAGCGDDFADEVDRITSIIEANPKVSRWRRGVREAARSAW